MTKRTISRLVFAGFMLAFTTTSFAGRGDQPTESICPVAKKGSLADVGSMLPRKFSTDHTQSTGSNQSSGSNNAEGSRR